MIISTEKNKLCVALLYSKMAALNKNSHKQSSNLDSRREKLGRLDEHTLGYYRRVASTLAEGFSDEEERGNNDML